LPLGDQHNNNESTNENLPPMLLKARRLLSQVTSASSGIISLVVSSDRPVYRRIWFWVGLGVGGGVIACNYGIAAIDRTLPDKATLNAIVREQTLTIKAADGTVLQQQGEVAWEQLNLEKIPDTLQQAFIASEDRRFQSHTGVDPQGILRAFINNLRSNDLVEGGSTITQQLARILFLKQERTFWRKLKEIRLAQKIERELTKQQILERYLNLVYLGSGAYGVGDAAWIYFSKPVDQLTLSEMATIAGLAPAPNAYAPDKNPQAATARRNLVLERMQEAGFITPEQRLAASQETLIVNSNPPRRLEIESPYFTSYIQQELPKYVSAKVLAGGGLIVETTLNPTWQKSAEAAVEKTLKNQGSWENFKEAALVAIDPRNGEIMAMVGGKDFGKNQFNRVTQAKRQPGSTFKGFVYATAIATGKSPYDTYIDEPMSVDGYEPKNFRENFRGEMTMKDALTRSVNIVAVKVLLDVGFEPIIKLAQDMGIKSELKPTYSLALGSNEVNLLELTSAYGAFATQGLRTEAHGIRRILNRQGQVIWSANYQSKRALDEETAAIMTWMLRSVVEKGTGTPAQLDDRPVAGKTGTSDEARDLWFIGYIPQVVAGVWLGNDDNRPTWGSSTSAAYTWHQFMKKVVEEMPVEKFPELPKLENRKGTIKAQPLKGKKIETGYVKNEEKSDDDNETSNSSSRRRRRRRGYSQVDSRDYNYSSRSQSSSQQESDNNQEQERPRRRRRRSSSSESSNNSSSEPSRSSQENSSQQSGAENSSSSSSSDSSSESSPSKPSWRERLKPSSSAGE
jgi:penicillin-binding protein 1A